MRRKRSKKLKTMIDDWRRIHIAKEDRIMGSRSIIGCVFALLLGVGENAVAHPLGNFSISQYSALRVSKQEVELRYVIDMAEIPTFQEIQETGLVAKTDDTSVEPYVARKVESLRDGLALNVNGRKVALQARSFEIIFPEGAGGLPTLKIGAVYKGNIVGDTGAAYTLSYRDGNFRGRAGWKEIIATAADGVELINSTVPETDRSAELSNYPTDLLNSPPQVLEARIEFAPTLLPVANGSAAPSQTKIETTQSNYLGASQKITNPIVTATADTPSSSEQAIIDTPTTKAPIQLQANQQATPKNSFTELIAAKQLDWPMLLFAFLAAAVLGAFHALEPGHGKTLVAAYLVGSRGTVKHALLLGLIVTASHTAGVYLLGAVTLYASNHVVPERLYPWLALSSGVMIMTLGLLLFLRRYRTKSAAHDDNHNHTLQHPHHHDHEHDHDHHHHGSPSHGHHKHNHEVSLKQLLTLGISGGIIPCPAALVVLLSAISLQRVGFGLLLIVAFSVGLAAVLMSIGLLMVYAQQFMARFQMTGRVTTCWLPLASSAFIVLFGVALTWQALQNSGLLRSVS